MITELRITTLAKFSLDYAKHEHVPVNYVFNFSFSVVPQTNVIVSGEHPKGSTHEESPLENLLSK